MTTADGSSRTAAAKTASRDVLTVVDQRTGESYEIPIVDGAIRAIDLRRELGENEPYVIARGPDAESALLYLAIPPSLVDAVAAITPLTGVVITGRVRTGRSSPVGVPILDLVSIVRR